MCTQYTLYSSPVLIFFVVFICTMFLWRNVLLLYLKNLFYRYYKKRFHKCRNTRKKGNTFFLHFDTLWATWTQLWAIKNFIIWLTVGRSNKNITNMIDDQGPKTFCRHPLDFTVTLILCDEDFFFLRFSHCSYGLKKNAHALQKGPTHTLTQFPDNICIFICVLYTLCIWHCPPGH